MPIRSVQPYTDAAELIAQAFGGDPAKKAEFDKLDQQKHEFDLEYALKQRADARDEAYNPARIRSAEEGANQSAADAASKNMSNDARRKRLGDAMGLDSPAPSAPQGISDHLLGVSPAPDAINASDLNSPSIPQIAQLLSQGAPAKPPAIPDNPATFAAKTAPTSLADHLAPAAPISVPPQSLTDHLAAGGPSNYGPPGAQPTQMPAPKPQGLTDKQIFDKANQAVIMDSEAEGGKAPDPKNRVAYITQYMLEAGRDPQYINRVVNALNMGNGQNLSTDNLKAQDLQTERTPAQRADLATADEAKKGGMTIDATGNLVPDRKLSAGEQKAVLDQKDIIDKSASSIQNLTDAKTILEQGDPYAKNSKPYTGTGADLRAGATAIPGIGGLIGDVNKGAATKDYENLVSQQVLDNFRAIFGSRPVAMELTFLNKLQALPSYSPEQQSAILQTGIDLAQRRHDAARTKADAIVKGDYQGMVNSDPAMTAHGGPKPGDIEDGHRFKGGNPADPNSWEIAQ